MGVLHPSKALRRMGAWLRATGEISWSYSIPSDHWSQPTFTRCSWPHISSLHEGNNCASWKKTLWLAGKALPVSSVSSSPPLQFRPSLSALVSIWSLAPRLCSLCTPQPLPSFYHSPPWATQAAFFLMYSLCSAFPRFPP